jgi:class 3 adenylate cyclase/tetratricopeptide (TPR) repeat protein/CheY-like chemotaxis protein
MDVVACPACREENPAKFRLCGFCGASLAPPETVRCPSCGEENPGKFRLCGYCGTALHATDVAPPAPAPPPLELEPSEVRKPVTFIFVDLKGSTALTERIDQEAMNEIKKRYFTVMAAQIEQHGGTIEKYIGDAIMAVFGIPKAREDDALRAVRAAYGMQRELDRLNEDFLRYYGVELANRTGVNTGEVVANTDPTANQQLATGDTVNVAARLEQAAPANEILIGQTTYDLVRSQVEVEPVEPLELKGKSERVAAYRLVALRTVAEEPASLAADAPLVGRDIQVELLRTTLADAVSAGGCRIATVLGEPGVGKTHMVETFAAQVSATTRVLRGRCLPYGDGITFWPLMEVVRDASGIVEDDGPDVALAKLALPLDGRPGASDILDRIASVLGMSQARYPVTEIFWGARRYLEALAARLPVVVIIEDIHYAEATFLELLEHLRDTTDREAPILIIATARLDLLDRHAVWGSGEHTTLVSMSPLDPEDTGRLIEAILGGQVADAVRAQLVGSAEGNPLFVSQLISMLVDKGMLRRDDDLWVATGDLEDLAVPPSIQALLAARLDDLARGERAVLEPASVIGLAFPQPAVAELVPAGLRAAVPEHLSTLDRKQFIGRESATTADDDLYRFRNLLIRDATYGSLLKRARAQTHERFVEWAERVNRERGREQEFEEILGYHLEQAYRYRTELGPIDEEGRSIATRAAEKLGAAGRRAFARGDLPAAASLLRRAVALTEATEVSSIQLRVDLGEVLHEAGEFEEATAVFEAAIAAAHTLEHAGLEARGRLGRLGVAVYSEELEADDTLRATEEARTAITLFETTEDEAGLARAWRLLASIHSTSGQYEQAAEAALRVVEYATRAGDRRLASRAAGGYATIARVGHMRAPDVVLRCQPLLEQVAGDRMAEAIILAVIAVAEAMQGRFEQARDLHARARRILAELGRSVVAASTSIEGARIEMLAGDAVAAGALLRADVDELGRMGERYFRSTIAALLAHALEAQGILDEAEDFARLAQELADEDDVDSQVGWRTALAKVRSRQGRAEARDLVAEALRLVAHTDDIELRGDVESDYGLVLIRLGHAADARPHLEAAVTLYQEKGNDALAVRSQQMIDTAIPSDATA